MTDLVQSSPQELTPPPASPVQYLFDANAFDHIWRVANAFAGSKMVPIAFQNKPQDAFVVLQMALQLEINPLLCLQNVQVINGRPGFSSAFAIALCNQRGPFNGPLTWETEGNGDDLAVTCSAVVKETGEVVAVTTSMVMAKAENWTKNPKYKSIPEQMLRYRSATWLIRLYCPEVLFGMQSQEEIVDMRPLKSENARREDPLVESKIHLINAKIEADEPTEVVADALPAQPEVAEIPPPEVGETPPPIF